jgi:hypothetical protein
VFYHGCGLDLRACEAPVTSRWEHAISISSPASIHSHGPDQAPLACGLLGCRIRTSTGTLPAPPQWSRPGGALSCLDVQRPRSKNRSTAMRSSCITASMVVENGSPHHPHFLRRAWVTQDAESQTRSSRHDQLFGSQGAFSPRGMCHPMFISPTCQGEVGWLRRELPGLSAPP